MSTSQVVHGVDGTSVRPTHLEPDSMFGIYLRELLLDLNALGFEGASSLFDEVVAYIRAVEEEQWSEGGQMATSDVSSTPRITGANTRKASARQLQHYLQVAGEGGPSICSKRGPSLPPSPDPSSCRFD